MSTDAFNGTSFIAADEQLTEEDGPLDTHAEHLARGQVIWLQREQGDRTALTLRRKQGTSGDITFGRPYCSSGWSTWLIAPYSSAAGLSQLDVSLYLRVAGPTAATESLASVDVRVRLLGVGEVVETITATTGYESRVITLTLDEPIAAGVNTYLLLDVRCKVVQFDIAGETQSGVSFFNGQFQGLTFPAPVDPSPDPANAEVQVLHTSGEQTNIRDVLNWWAVDRVSCEPPLQDPQSYTLGRGYMSMLQVRGVEVEQTYATDPYAGELIRAAIPVEGVATARPIITQNAIAQRPRAMSLGYPGLVDQDTIDSEWIYPQQWRYGSAGDSSIVFDDIIWIDRIDRGLDVQLLVIPYHVRGDGAPYAVADRATLDGDATQAVWDFQATLRRWDGATLVTDAAETSEVTLQHLGTSVIGVWPFLAQMYARHSVVKPGPGDMSQTLKEGQLYDPDLSLFRLVTIRLRPELGSAEVMQPFELFVTAVNDTSTLEYRFNQQPSENVAANVRLAVVGAAVWSR